MSAKAVARLRYFAGLWALGIVLLASSTWAARQLDFDAATTAFVYLIVIVVLAMMDSFVSSVIFSVVAAQCLNFFFVPPLYTFDIADARDIINLVAFIFASLVVTGLMRRTRRLGEASRKQAELLDLTHDCVIVRDLDDVITYWNRGAEELYGWSSDEAIGKITHELLGTVFPVPPEEIRKILLRTGRWEGELTHFTRFGRELTVASRWSLQRDEDGAAVGTLETNNDVTERERTRNALRRTQETFLAEAQRLSRTGSFGWNMATGAISWSEECFRIFDIDPGGDASLDAFLRRVHPDDIARIREMIELSASGIRDFEFEHRLLMPDGAVKNIHLVAHAVQAEGERPHLMGALMDITARRQAEAALRFNEQRYRHLFHHMPVALWQLDERPLIELFAKLRAEGVTDLAARLRLDPTLVARAMAAIRVDGVNARAMSMFGVDSASGFLGGTVHFWRDNEATFRRALESRFRGEETFQEEARIVAPDGRATDVLFTMSRSGPDNEFGIGILGLVDISERTRAQEALQRLQAEFAHAARISVLGELTASIAHEINQPLAAVTTNAEVGLRWLNRPEPNVAKVRELVQRVVEDARRAADIIARIRAMAAGRTPRQEGLALSDIIERSVVFLRHELVSKNVTLSLDLAPALPAVTGDRTQLQQVVVNLSVNAVQAMTQAEAARRELLVRTSTPDPGTVCCTIEDSGPGIDPAHLHRLFDSFFTTKETGMGMGLAISRSIIEAHGGRIQADNESSLGGARFSFTLPILETMAAATEMPEAAAAVRP